MTRLHKLQFNTRGLMAFVAILAFEMWVYQQIWYANLPVLIALVATNAALFGLGAMRHPWFFLTITFLLIVGSPTVHDSVVYPFFHFSYSLSWIMGATAGWIIRSLKKRNSNAPPYIVIPE